MECLRPGRHRSAVDAEPVAVPSFGIDVQLGGNPGPAQCLVQLHAPRSRNTVIVRVDHKSRRRIARNELIDIIRYGGIDRRKETGFGSLFLMAAFLFYGDSPSPSTMVLRKPSVYFQFLSIASRVMTSTRSFFGSMHTMAPDTAG